MVRWLTAAAVVWLSASSGAQAQMKALGAVEIAEAAKNHTLDFRISKEPVGPTGLPLSPSMLVHQDLAPGAAVGLGLAQIYERRRRGDTRAGQGVVRSRAPAVSFELKF
jgi:hypothetical protein